jgi:hypothetical protein
VRVAFGALFQADQHAPVHRESDGLDDGRPEPEWADEVV